MRRYQHGEYDLAEVREALAVGFALAGNYLQQEGKIRLTVELIDLETEQTYWMNELAHASTLPYLFGVFTPGEVAEQLADRIGSSL